MVSALRSGNHRWGLIFAVLRSSTAVTAAPDPNQRASQGGHRTVSGLPHSKAGNSTHAVFPLTCLRSAPFPTLHSAWVDTTGCYICLREIIFWIFSHLDQNISCCTMISESIRVHSIQSASITCKRAAGCLQEVNLPMVNQCRVYIQHWMTSAAANTRT